MGGRRSVPTILVLTSLGLLLAALGAGEHTQPAEVRLGEPAPDFTLPDRAGRQWALGDFRGKKNAVLVFSDAIAKPEALVPEASALAAVDTALVLIQTDSRIGRGRQAGPTLSNLYLLMDTDGAVTGRYLVQTSRRGTDARVTLLVDKAGIVRRIEANVAEGQLVEFVRHWQTGQTLFAIACIRCHEDESYPLIKNLAGIGNRLTRDQILERLFPVTFTPNQIAVRSHVFSRQELDALITYVAGL